MTASHFQRTMLEQQATSVICKTHLETRKLKPKHVIIPKVISSVSNKSLLNIGRKQGLDHTAAKWQQMESLELLEMESITPKAKVICVLYMQELKCCLPEVKLV